MSYLPVWASFLHGDSAIFKFGTTFTGRDIAPLAFALGLVVLAGSVIVWVLAGAWVRVAGVILVLASAAMVFAPLKFRASPLSASIAAYFTRTGEKQGGLFGAVVTTTMWWLPALIGGVIALFAAFIVVFHRGRWGGFSARYERTGTKPAPSAAKSRAATWDALDQGLDPTQELPGEPAEG